MANPPVKKPAKASAAKTSKVDITTLMAAPEETDSSVPVARLDLFTRGALVSYGTEINEERHIPCLYDGLKPVQRRILWVVAKSTSRKRHVKTAQVVGEVAGSYHAHGDVSITNAVTGMVNESHPQVQGKGLFGDAESRAAAPRYTNVEISALGEQSTTPDYIKVSPLVDSYTGTHKEPIMLPARLPFVLMEPTSGIGLGVSTNMPGFTLQSLLKACSLLLNDPDTSNAKLAKVLKLTYVWGGTPVNTPANAQAIESLMSNHKASVTWKPTMKVDAQAKTITIIGLCPGLNFASKEFNALKEVPGIVSINTEELGITRTIRCKRNTQPVQFQAIVSAVEKVATQKLHYNICVTKRLPQKDASGELNGNYRVTFHKYSVREVLESWLRFRVNLEKKVTRYRMARLSEEAAGLELRLYAAANLDTVVKSIKQDNPAAYLMKHLSMTQEEAATVLMMRVHQLSKLDTSKTNARLKLVKSTLKAQKAILADPVPQILAYFESVASNLCQVSPSSYEVRLHCNQVFLDGPRSLFEQLPQALVSDAVPEPSAPAEP